MLVEKHQQGVHDHENGYESSDEGHHAEHLDNHVDNPRMNADTNHVSGIANVIVSRRVKNVAYGENCERGNDGMGTARGFRSWGL